ncbi:hypothetical protein PhaeoP75_02340 [Phaeobacter gallaeciensis]|uniref:Uncharacterized protein n=2 Tax=Roseobacteraceae TaxID=2854170 RepID=A0AAC9Z9L8_9RHOB|nr:MULTISPECIES: hypothetical protein [Phaeobacter]AHD10047.1 hypothetical protein Gal_02300 [Phaeobacter gallaeciensis DSM 26640]ATE93311.1 hypothetical protein PhaeoP11_02291 [Phaeobacter gallaeciensis]ATE96868.1 hypothetical protein PhaeoP73_01556 [Phaeobacter gallaeciensis]ATF01975.1 hypothetical protein PhaeoP75_02340 [Phaeobacter gallaeciensis]ATF06355.1 hypothetical protein PhaeoP63_02289 [Phaeobacter gallaeciensis]
MMADQIITDEVKYVTATQAINSPRWPFGRDKFYRMVQRGKITPSIPFEGSRKVYSVAQIDGLFQAPSEQ